MFLYVYMHLDPRSTAVRYIGVGPLSRAHDFQLRAPQHLAWIAELDALDLEPLVVLPSKTRDRAEAFEVERLLITWHRKNRSALFNVTAGGKGASGVTVSETQKQHLSSVQTAKWLFDPEFRARRLPDLVKARAALNRTPEHRSKITKHARVTGSPCKKCGGTLRYKTGRNCVNCTKRS